MRLERHAAQPGAKHVGPRIDDERPSPKLVELDRPDPSVSIVVVDHRRGFGATVGSRESNSRAQQIVALLEDVRADFTHAADDALRGKAAAVDRRAYVGNDETIRRPLISRFGRACAL